MFFLVLLLQGLAGSALPEASSASVHTRYVTRTSMSTVTTTLWYRAGLVLLNDMVISGTDAFHKDFVVDNTAAIYYANPDFNVFALPTTATCACIKTLKAMASSARPLPASTSR